jgi:hypothetical protein
VVFTTFGTSLSSDIINKETIIDLLTLLLPTKLTIKPINQLRMMMMMRKKKKSELILNDI